MGRGNGSTNHVEMGERKGQNFYYPPDFDPKKHKTLNGYHGVHALRERACKIGQGILIIRFEMPFNIWCLGCHNHVAMGVRYNAEKKKVGMYFTTPLYEFRMKCVYCDTFYVIRTDPKNFDYELVEGCKRQEKRWDPSTEDGHAPIDRAFTHKLAADPMFKVEHHEEDKIKGTTEDQRQDKIEWVQERLRDDYAANQALRRQFRREKADLTEKRAADADLLSRASLSIPLVPEREEDKKVASMLQRYKTVKTYEERQAEHRDAIESMRIFDKPGSSNVKATSNDPADRLKQSIRSKRNRDMNDSFASFFCQGPSTSKRAMLGIVRKAKREQEQEQEEEDEEVVEVKQEGAGLGTAPVKEEQPDEKPDNKAPVALAALGDYGSSSDSD